MPEKTQPLNLPKLQLGVEAPEKVTEPFERFPIGVDPNGFCHETKTVQNGSGFKAGKRAPQAEAWGE